MLWYPVQDTDANTVIVNGMTGVKDVFDHTLDTSQYHVDSITGVALESVLMRNAPTALTADYDNGNASFTMNANMAQAYKTRIQRLSHPGRHRAEGSPFPPRTEGQLHG